MKSSIANGENRGSINNILLKALQSGDKYGYEINKEIEIKSKGKFFLKEASLYSGLKRLEANGYITSYWQDGELGIRRHYYSITEKGLEKLNSSNFTWDDSKDFISEMFKDSPITRNIKKDITPIENKNQDSIKTIENEQKVVAEVKKNPFQIEVSPLQQSIFDLNLNSEKIEQKIEDKAEEEIKNLEIVSENNNLDFPSNENKEDNLEKDEFKKLDNEDKSVTDEYQQINYDDIVNNYISNSYSHSLTDNKEKIDISKYLKNDKENSNNIIIEKSNIVEKINEQDILFNKQDDKTLENSEILINNSEIDNIEVELPAKDNESILDKFNNEQIKEENNVDIKNIFGSLLVDDVEEEKIENNNTLETEIDNIEKQIIKEELPRINVDNDINITLNSNRVKNITPPSQPTFQNEEINHIHISTNTPSVKQYINNVHKKTLISRATTVEEEVNLDGINIREYRKMNNKAIKNSNYIYKNKLNLFLTLVISSLLTIESIMSFVIFNNAKCLGIFEILFLSSCLLYSLALCYYFGYIYFKDKYKVELKKYNFKNSLFYCILILFVLLIIFMCINIFQGMNTNNSQDFVVKIILELIICLNIVLYPIVKLWFYNLKFFSN